MNLHPLRAVTSAEVGAFERDGAVCLPGLLDPAWLDVLRRGVNALIERPTPLHTVQTLAGEPGFFLSDICMSQASAALRDFVLNGPAAEAAAHLMGSGRANFWADTLWVKDSGTPKRTRWHQDQPFFWVDGEQMCVLWWPLDAVAAADSLQIVKGSHRWGKWYAPELSRAGQDLYRSVGSAFERMPDIGGRPEEYEILSWAVSPGDCVVFHGATVHGAPGNSAASRRRAISTIWMGDDTRYAARPSAGRPHFHGHDLEIGDPMDGGYFPRVWPREAERLDGDDFPRFTDPALRITN